MKYRFFSALATWVYSALVMWPIQDASKWVQVRVTQEDLTLARTLSVPYFLVLVATTLFLPAIQIQEKEVPVPSANLKKFAMFALLVAVSHTCYSIMFHSSLESFFVNLGTFIWLIGIPSGVFAAVLWRAFLNLESPR